MQVNDDIDAGKDFVSQIMGDDLGNGAFCIAGKTAIQIFAIQGGESGGGFGSGNIDCWNKDDTSGNFFQVQRFHQFHDCDLSGIFIAMISRHEEYSRACAAGHG